MNTFIAELRAAALPKGMEWYEIGGQIVFPRYGVKNTITTEALIYLLDTNSFYTSKTSPPQIKVLPIQIMGVNHPPEFALVVVKNALDKFSELAHLVNVDGTDLGVEGLDLREAA